MPYMNEYAYRLGVALYKQAANIGPITPAKPGGLVPVQSPMPTPRPLTKLPRPPFGSRR